MANDVLVYNGTAKTYKSSAGDAVFTGTSLANAAGRISGVVDYGTPRAGKYRVQVQTKFGTAPTAGNAVEVYLVRSDDNTNRDAALGSADAAVSDVDLKAQCMFIGNLVADNQNTGQQVASFEVETGARYLSVLLWNASGQALTATATDHIITITPIITQIQ
jgi:hypothetical protein